MCSVCTLVGPVPMLVHMVAWQTLGRAWARPGVPLWPVGCRFRWWVAQKGLSLSQVKEGQWTLHSGTSTREMHSLSDSLLPFNKRQEILLRASSSQPVQIDPASPSMSAGINAASAYGHFAKLWSLLWSVLSGRELAISLHE